MGKSLYCFVCYPYRGNISFCDITRTGQKPDHQALPKRGWGVRLDRDLGNPAQHGKIQGERLAAI